MSGLGKHFPKFLECHLGFPLVQQTLGYLFSPKNLDGRSKEAEGETEAGTHNSDVVIASRLVAQTELLIWNGTDHPPARGYQQVFQQTAI